MCTKDIISQDLAKIIDKCKSVARESQFEARSDIEFIQKSMNEAVDQITMCIEDIRSTKIKDTSSVQTLYKQLNSIQNKFKDQYEEVTKQLNLKSRQANKFNITLFGRTMVGKSTLMEILTNGNGKSIGNGSQRTTRDIREYVWNGLTITDVPGIDAFQGDNDERIAEDAAKYADIILFMISSGQPEYTEAEWLTKLKREDKPIICLCNVKQTLADDLDLQMFLDNPSDALDDKGVIECLDQFNSFVKQSLPNEHLKIYVTQLQARYLANQKQYSQYRKNLIKASRFSSVEYEIKKLVIENGIAFRKKCFLSIIDIPLYSQMLDLFSSSAEAYAQSLAANEKRNQFYDWKNEFISEEAKILRMKVNEIFNGFINSIPYFVDENIEKDDFQRLWENHLKSANINERVVESLKATHEKATRQISNFFASLNQELQLKFSLNTIFNDLRGKNIANWRKRWEWSSVLTGAISGIFVMCNVPVVGWVLGGITAIFVIFSWFSTSKEEKRRRTVNERVDELTRRLKKYQYETNKKVYELYKEKVVRDLIDDASGKWDIIRLTFRTLANTQRQLAFRYLNHHNEISRKMIDFALNDLGVKDVRIDFVARIPGRYCLIGSCNPYPPRILKQLSEKLGNKEEIRIFCNALSGETEHDLRLLRNYFKLSFIPKIKIVDKDGFKHKVLFVPKREYSPKVLDRFLLLQMILQIHIIPR